MKAYPINSGAERVGRVLGRTWRGALRREKELAGWLVGKGMPAGLVKLVTWLIKLFVLAVVFYFSLAIGLLIAALAIIARIVSHADTSTDRYQYEWREGLQGYGMYDRDGNRLDPFDPGKEP